MSCPSINQHGYQHLQQGIPQLQYTSQVPSTDCHRIFSIALIAGCKPTLDMASDRCCKHQAGSISEVVNLGLPCASLWRCSSHMLQSSTSRLGSLDCSAALDQGADGLPQSHEAETFKSEFNHCTCFLRNGAAGDCIGGVRDSGAYRPPTVCVMLK